MNDNRENKIFTIPNILSFFRILLIPVFVKFYVYDKNYVFAVSVLILSGLTDLADGYIARKYNAMSNLGRILDPIADKLTQIATLVCLVTRFPYMMVPLVLLVLKELIAGITGLMVIKKTGVVYNSEWHGKVSTTLLYAMMIIHIVWSNITPILSNVLILMCVIMIVLSFFLYSLKDFRLMKTAKRENENRNKNI